MSKGFPFEFFNEDLVHDDLELCAVTGARLDLKKFLKDKEKQYMLVCGYTKNQKITYIVKKLLKKLQKEIDEHKVELDEDVVDALEIISEMIYFDENKDNLKEAIENRLKGGNVRCLKL